MTKEFDTMQSAPTLTLEPFAEEVVEAPVVVEKSIKFLFYF